MKSGEEFLSIFDPNTPHESPSGAQLLEAKIEPLAEPDEDNTHFLYCLASVGPHVIAVLDMIVSPEDWTDSEEETDLWQEAFKKMEWNIEIPDNQLPKSISLRLYDFHAKAILILNIMSAIDPISFSKHNVPELRRPENPWDVLKISEGALKESQPNESEKRFLIGSLQTLLKLVEPRTDFQEEEVTADKLLLME